MFPDLEEPENPIPRGAKDLGNGFVLLRAQDGTARHIINVECQALKCYLQDTWGINIPPNWSLKYCDGHAYTYQMAKLLDQPGKRRSGHSKRFGWHGMSW